MQHRSGGVAVAAVVALALAACGSYDRRDPQALDNANRAAAVEAGLSNEDAAVLHLATCPEGETTLGVTDDQILIGTSSPRTGPFAAFGEILPGIRAYFDMVNRGGGVDGRELVLEALDDGYEPAGTRANVDRLLDDEEVFALFNVVGTPNVLSYWDTTEERCVPNLFVATGSPYWGDERGHPWTIGSLPSYATEAAIFAAHLEELQPDADVAILMQDDDFGEGYTDGFSEAIQDSDLSVAATETYDPDDADVTQQVERLASTEADAMLGAVTGLACPSAMRALADSVWDPVTYVSGTCVAAPLLDLAGGAADGVLSTTYLMDPRDPAWDEVASMQLYKAELARSQPGADPGDGFTAYGWTTAALLVETLRAADDLTRPAVMAAARGLDGVIAGLVLPGVTFSTGPGDPYPVESTQLMQYDAGRGLWDFLPVGAQSSGAAGPRTISLSSQEGQTPAFSAR
jgi:branched-chain amino acid transport system substrate-binding protein